MVCGTEAVPGHHLSDLWHHPLVPGAGIYRAAYYTVTNQLYLAVQTGFDAVKMAVAIVLGIVFVLKFRRRYFRLAIREPIKNTNFYR